MEHPVSVRLGHLGVDVVAAVAELGDLLGEQLDPLSGVAEDDALVDLQLGEERVEAVHLLPLLGGNSIEKFQLEFWLELDGNPYNGPLAIMVKGKHDTGSKGGLIHNTWYWLVTLNLVVSLNLLVTLNLVVTLILMAPESNLP